MVSPVKSCTRFWEGVPRGEAGTVKCVVAATSVPAPARVVNLFPPNLSSLAIILGFTIVSVLVLATYIYIYILCPVFFETTLLGRSTCTSSGEDPRPMPRKTPPEYRKEK